MWICSKWGFFSIVAALDDDGELDTTRMVIRSRRRQHLEALAANVDDHLFSPVEILSTPESDYPFRVVVCAETAWRVVEQLSRSVDYSNFKNAVANQLTVDADYLRFLHHTWAAGLDFMEDWRQG